MTATLREYCENDLDQLMAVWEKSSALAHPFLPGQFVAQVREAIPKLYLPNAETWVTVVADRVIGFIALLGSVVGAVFVDPEHHGKGFGRQLMDKARRLKGELEVDVFAENSIGCRFYRNYGFSEIATNSHQETGCALIRFRLSAPAAPEQIDSLQTDS